MSTKNIAIAYCTDNEEVVKKLEQQLSLSGYQFQRYAGTRSTAGTPLADQLLNQPNPILLIVSDNFLKAAQCMSHGLKLLQEKRGQILPVVISGSSKDEQSGETIRIQTDFERVSDIIQYINYWQDQYLDLRRQKRQMKDFDEEAFNTHLKVMREISSEAGEFLRVLRGMNYLAHQQLAANAFEQFFKFTNDPEGWNRFRSKAPVISWEEEPSFIPADEEEKAPAEKPAAPAMEESAPEEEHPVSVPEEVRPAEEELPPAGLPEIPEISPAGQNQEEAPAEKVEEELPEEAPSMAEEAIEEVAASIELGLEEARMEWAVPAAAEEEEEEAQQKFYLDDDEDDSLVEEEEVEEEVEVEVEVEEEVEEEEDQVSLLVEEALEYFNTGQVQEGLAFMAQAVEENPTSPYLRYHYALMLAQRARDYRTARKILEPVATAEPENQDALFLMGELNELLEDFDAARQYYHHLIDINPMYPNAYYRLGMITAAHFEEEKKAAAHFFKKALKQDGHNADASYQYGLLLSEALDKPKKAIKYFQRTLKIDPAHPFANYDLALVYHHLGQTSRARKAYARAIAINPELRTPENDLAFQEKSAATPGITSSLGHDTIEALKENINRLEELLQAREEETVLLRQEMDKEEEEAPAPKVDQTVLITGATSGIGKATAEIFARHGYRVIITGRRARRLEELKARLQEEYGAGILAIAYDVRDAESVEEVMDKLSGEWSEIDILVNNAGKAKGLAPIHEGQLEHWEEMIDTNLKGLLYMTRAVSPGMVQRRSGHIINVSSTAGRDVYPNGNVYCATKAAVETLTRAIRLDLHKHNVKVSMVSPAHVEETEFALVRFDGDEEKAKIYEGFKPLSPRDVADAIFFLATRPAHVNILDVVLQGVQQASSLVIDRSGRERYEEEEED